MKNSILQVTNLSARFNLKKEKSLFPALNRISFHVDEDEVLGIIGESGSGKSITLLSILGLLRGDPGVIDGEILFRSQDEENNTLENISQYITINNFETCNETVSKEVNQWNRLQRKRYKNILGKKVSMVFQNPRLAFNPYYSIGKQISESILLHKPNSNKESAKLDAIKWLERVKMEEPSLRYNNNPYGLSGGLCQRAMIAMALASEPKLLIADEPTTGLDATIQGDVLSLLAEIKEQEKISMIIVSHDFNVMNRLANRVLVYYKGFIIEEGDTTHIINHHSNQHHPYTTQLLNAEYNEGTRGVAEKNKDKDKDKDKTLIFFKSCPYASNCSEKTSVIAHKCENIVPPLFKTNNAHRIRCWKFE